jgi:hypothetical protein
MSKNKTSVFLNYSKALRDPGLFNINTLKNIKRRFGESGLNTNGSFAKHVEHLIKIAPRTVKINRSTNMKRNWSPRTKQAARTIKRIVTKKYAQNKYKNYIGGNYTSIRKGYYPLHTESIQRRMRTHPINVNVPIYRGITPNRGPLTLNRVFVNKKIVNKSFASFSKNRSVAKMFAGNLQNNGYIIVLPPGRYPAINRKKFIRNNAEEEITLAPGVYTLNTLSKNIITSNGNIRVAYKPL